MKLPNFKRLIYSDFEEKYRQLVDTLAASLNVGMDAIYDALNGKLSLADNLLTDVKDLQLTVDSDGVPTARKTFQVNKNITNLKGLQVIRADNVDDPRIYPSGGVFINFTIVTQGVEILHVTGLQAGYIYQLRIVAWG